MKLSKPVVQYHDISIASFLVLDTTMDSDIKDLRYFTSQHKDEPSDTSNKFLHLHSSSVKIGHTMEVVVYIGQVYAEIYFRHHISDCLHFDHHIVIFQT